MTWADRAIRGAAVVAVAFLAFVAGAVSYAHMLALAEHHGQTGWREDAFPLSVDGIEFVASLVMFADRRVGRRSGGLVWTALVIGTVASLAANVAVGSSDVIGRIVAGWPACSLLLAIKLLSGLMDHHRDVPSAVQPTSMVAPAAADGPIVERHRDGPTPQTVPIRPAHPSRTGERRSAPADLVPAAVAVRDAVIRDGGKFTRAVLADRLRAQGITVSNARLTELLHAVAAQPLALAAGPDGEAR